MELRFKTKDILTLTSIIKKVDCSGELYYCINNVICSELGEKIDA